MSLERDARIRRYLLGQASETDSAAIEQEYFAGEAAVDSVAAQEEALIEDYLSNRLNVEDRQQFETVYLASPAHRHRVAVMRALVTSSSRAATKRAAPVVTRHSQPVFRVGRRAWALPVAAALLLAVGSWFFQRQDTTDVAVDDTPSAPAPSPPEAPAPRVEPRVFAMSLVPSATRAPDDNVALVIPDGIDVVSLTLQGERVPDAGDLQVVVRTVPGQEVWRGAATGPRDDEIGVSARAEVPAAALPPDDYFVTLADQAGDVNQYFLRVRDR